jgi:hypothetical protein
MEKPYDLIAIGDTVMDVFIKLSVGHVQESAVGPELCIPYGSKIPYDNATLLPAVGNSANAAVSAARLGLHSALISFLGKDDHGNACLAKLQQEHVSTEFITQEEGTPTNYHYVLWYGDDRTILIKHSDFHEKLPENLTPPKWIYLSSLGAGTETFHSDIDGSDVEKTVILVGVLSSKKIIKTKKDNSEMAFLTVFDETGSIEVVVFPKLYKQVSTKININQVIIFKGKVNERDDQLTVIMDVMKPLG